MIKGLGKRENITIKNVELREGERNLLPSSKSDIRSPSLDYLNTSAENVPEELILDYLASIICDIYLHQINGNKKSSDLLQGLNKRTG